MVEEQPVEQIINHEEGEEEDQAKKRIEEMKQKALDKAEAKRL